MRRPIRKQLGTLGVGAIFVFIGINGVRLARIAEVQHVGVFFRLAWMSPLQAYIVSVMCLALGLYIMFFSFIQRRKG